MVMVVMMVMKTEPDVHITEDLWTEGIGGGMIREGHTGRFRG